MLLSSAKAAALLLAAAGVPTALAQEFKIGTKGEFEFGAVSFVCQARHPPLPKKKD